jgi:beta-lactamase class A
MKARWIFLLVLMLGAAPTRADEGELPATARKVADQIAEHPANLAGLYAPKFLQAVPEEKLAGLYQSMFSQHGAVLKVTALSGGTDTAGKFTFSCKDADIPVTLSIEAAPPHRVVGLWFGPAAPRVQSLEQVTAELAKLPGKVSYQLQCLDDGKVIASHDPDTALAIGSTFKLFVLATLIEQKVPWDQVIKLDDRFMSVGGGDMEHWPAGSPVTVDTLAVQMISRSDNTAADQLLGLAGRENVEAMLPRLGVKDPSADTPFLSTAEMFRLKTDPDVLTRYLTADQAGRAKIVANLPATPPPDIGKLVALGPTVIDKIEWFASAADLCRVMRWYYQHADATALSILAINPGTGAIDNSSGKFAYIGYKGGSEPGVLSLNWLLHTRAGGHYALSVTWNDPSHNVDEAKLCGLTSAATDLLGGK